MLEMTPEESHVYRIGMRPLIIDPSGVALRISMSIMTSPMAKYQID